MKISQNLEAAAVIDLQSTTGNDVIAELIRVAHRVYEFKEPVDRVIEVVQARERIGSTGLGGGVAIPHAQFSNLDREIVAVGRSAKGVDFNAADLQDVNVFFLLLGPRNVKAHLAVLAAIARVSKSDDFVQKVLAAESTAAIYKLIESIDA